MTDCEIIWANYPNNITMSVAAIIVNYNAGTWLSRCVRSVLAEPLISKIYVVDNDSKDDSLAEMKHSLTEESIDASRLQVIQNEHNLGFGKANNQVMNQLLVEDEINYILLINPDCDLKKGVLNRLLPYFEQHAKLGMAGCVIKNSDGSVQATCRRAFPTPLTAFLRLTQLNRFAFVRDRVENAEFNLGNEPLSDEQEAFIEVEAISGAFMLVRKSAIKEVGVFDEAYFMHCEDLDWCKRFAEKGWQTGFVADVHVVHEKGVSSQARPIGVLWNLHQGMLLFFEKFYRDSSPWILRLVVRLGIYCSFLLRALLSLLKQGMQLVSKNG